MRPLDEMPWELSDEEYDAIHHALHEARGWMCKRSEADNWVEYALLVLTKKWDDPLPEPPSDDDGLYASQRPGYKWQN